MVNILIIGATGFIGGDALYAIEKAYPDADITCLVRNSDRGAVVAKTYPKVKLAYGSLDDYDIIKEEASKASIVLNCANCDHEGAASAIVEGLSQRDTKSFIIHTSGTAILCFADMGKSIGAASDKIYNDWDGIKEVTSLPDDAPHRTVDKIILAANKTSGGKIQTAIVCPPTIYGPGRGPGNQKSDQINKLAKAYMERGNAFMIGDGLNKWTSIHVHDLSDLYLRLLTEAVDGGDKATWNDAGYYFVENDEFEWGDTQKKVATEVHKLGLIKSTEMEKITSVEEADKLGGFWGYNSRCRALRAKKLLGWSASGDSLVSTLPATVKVEAVDLGLVKKGYAETVEN
ncbi:NAD dependent epimerase/dehydratase family protein [Microthyrium microscopicum]|uniref:NAD dependent epimerase/dehydratase family protein n=1 Tax=Microthyrium microscopicum TaxID=703497 RepID=A0A6A6UM93_9PEZI|nr:NAD dependent epimerase/dehydratase family protein [Microthyrium microscopicum]